MRAIDRRRRAVLLDNIRCAAERNLAPLVQFKKDRMRYGFWNGNIEGQAAIDATLRAFGVEVAP